MARTSRNTTGTKSFQKLLNPFERQSAQRRLPFLSAMKEVNRQHKILAALLVTLGSLCVIIWMSRGPLLRLGLCQTGVQVVLDGHEFKEGAREGYAIVTLQNNTDRTISVPVLRDMDRRVAAVISSVRTGSEWTAVAWDETAKGEVFVQLEAKAGGTVQLLVPLKAGAAPKRVALLCSGVPEAAVMKWKRLFANAMARIGVPIALQIKPADSDQEVWCSQELRLPDRPLRQ